MIMGPSGTDKFAFLSREEHNPASESKLYHLTLDRFTDDCEWRKEIYDLLPSAEKVAEGEIVDQKLAYRKLCAQTGRMMWAIRILDIEMPMPSYDHSLHKYLGVVNK
jgi:hypothetical protein